jgi:hypothetical protein
MSAFTVSTLTIDRCVSGMYRHWRGGDAETLLGQQLMRLNRRALSERYADRHPEDRATDPEIEGYRHSPQAPDPYLFLVALECLLYQCSEGEVVKDPLYAELERAVQHWRSVILAALPEYQTAARQAWQ